MAFASLSYTTRTCTPPPDLPPKEITALSHLSYAGDLDEPLINEEFQRNLASFEQKGHQSYELWPVLLSAVQSARPGMIKLLFSRGMAMNETYIRQAIDSRSRDVLQAFFDSGWDVNTVWNNFYPPLLASFVNDPSLTQFLLDRGADPDARCYLDLTPLSIAVKCAPLHTIKMLLDKGSVWKGELLHYALERDKDTIQVLQLLLARGANINKVKYANDQKSWDHEHFKGLGTPLHKAVEIGKVNVVRYLLTMGADKDILDTKHRTALALAVEKKDASMVNLLTVS